jgi:C-terminal processing protease CtpA/Prc
MTADPFLPLRYVSALTVVVCLASTPRLGAQTAPEVQNLRAFTKLYGYVRYFHPSDAAASVPWEAFVVHGIRQAKSARSTDELRRVLERLFHPIAPTVQVFATGDAPPAPIVSARGDTAGPVVWQHVGVGLTDHRTYRSVRLNRPIAAGVGTFTGLADAAPYRGRTVRLLGWVRADVAGAGNQGQLWLRVDRTGRERGFFANMDDRPITAPDWRPYQIVGQVAEDATWIVFGGFLRGRGTIWVDDFELAVQEPGGQWTSIPVTNAGFEDVDDAGRPFGWTAVSPGYQLALGEQAHGGNRALVIRHLTDPADTPLFAGLPRIGDAVIRDLGAGLSARIPLALARDDSAAHGVPDAPSLAALRADLQRVGPDTLTAADEGLRLADVAITWNVLRHFYPYFDVVPGDWDAALPVALGAALRDRGATEFLHTLDRLVAALHDGHGRVVPRGASRANIPAALMWIEEQVVVSRTADSALRPGDVVVTLDGRDARALVRDREAEVSGSPQWKRYRAVRELGLGDEGSTATLGIRRDGRTIEVTLRRAAAPLPGREGPPVRLLEAGIWYVDLDRAAMPEIREHLAEIAGARGVVFDLRGYPNSNHEVLSHLLTGPDTSAAWMRVPMTAYPDRERPAGFSRHGWGLRPAGPHIAGRVVFLTDARAISYAESFMSFVEHYRLGEIIGQPTAGTNGNVNVLTLPGGYQVLWTGMRVVKHDGSQHHLVGIQPTIPMTPTIAGVRAGRDELLERAVAVIRDGDGRPAR